MTLHRIAPMTPIQTLTIALMLAFALTMYFVFSAFASAV
jgi:hypothetical protein